jgi:hypothetical protein
MDRRLQELAGGALRGIAIGVGIVSAVMLIALKGCG